MKTKIFLLVSLFAGILTFSLSAQNGKGADNKTYVYPLSIENNTSDLPVICDGKEVDVLNWTPYVLRCLDHYTNGDLTWYKSMDNNMIFTSTKTKEVFRGQFKEEYEEGGKYYWHLNLNGNMGHHYFVKTVYDATTWDLIEIKSNCK